MGKTTLAYALARSTDCAFSRVQFTSDLWPSDVTGVAIYNDRERSFVFKPGPVFANVVLAGEINRVTPKTQSALLEVMDRARVTLERGAAALKAWLEGPWDFRRLAMALMLTVGGAAGVWAVWYLRGWLRDVSWGKWERRVDPVRREAGRRARSDGRGRGVAGRTGAVALRPAGDVDAAGGDFQAGAARGEGAAAGGGQDESRRSPKMNYGENLCFKIRETPSSRKIFEGCIRGTKERSRSTR